MQKLLLWPAVALALLVGCSSVGRSPAPPQPTGPSVNETMATVQTSLSDGVGITALLNKEYNENSTSCTEYGTGRTRGYYFCTGVLLRTTDDGAFPPWESSPTAITLSGTSYSWLRHDLVTTALFKPAGFIVLNPAEVLAGTVPGISYGKYGNGQPLVQCVYPFDAWTTRTMNRAEFGCDFEGSGWGAYAFGNAWGSCESKLGYSTAAQWNSHFRDVGQVVYGQCSWNADNQQGWRNMIASHNAILAGGLSSYNEVVLYNGGPAEYVPGTTEQMRLWTLAFFYDVAKPAGWATAQNFQRKMAATGKRVPIVRLNFTAPASQRFQFQQADQVPGLYP